VSREARDAMRAARATREWADAQGRVKASGKFDTSPVWSWAALLDVLDEAASALAGDLKGHAAGVTKALSHRYRLKAG
jgi:hypothetical protein